MPTNTNMRVVFASGNASKLREMRSLISNTRLTLIAQNEFAITPVAETGYSFYENALVKAIHASKQSGLPALADDSGLVVPSLHGKPGIHSARYAGENSKDADNIAKLLQTMRGMKGEDRYAWFYCVLVFVCHPNEAQPTIGRGTLHGSIATQAKGRHGFGYDPVFTITEQSYRTVFRQADTINEKTTAIQQKTLHHTLAQLDIATKNIFSHRARATTNLMNKITHNK